MRGFYAFTYSLYPQRNSCIHSLFLFTSYGVSPLSRVDGAGAAVREEVKMENGHSSPLLGALPEGDRAEQMEGAASAIGRLV